jgi:hypothetical protein
MQFEINSDVPLFVPGRKTISQPLAEAKVVKREQRKLSPDPTDEEIAQLQADREQLDNWPISFVCRRERSEPTMQTRIFKAKCGTKFTVEIGASRKIKRYFTDYPCTANCACCRQQIEIFKNLIANGK